MDIGRGSGGETRPRSGNRSAHALRPEDDSARTRAHRRWANAEGERDSPPRRKFSSQSAPEKNCGPPGGPCTLEGRGTQCPSRRQGVCGGHAGRGTLKEAPMTGERSHWKRLAVLTVLAL